MLGSITLAGLLTLINGVGVSEHEEGRSPGETVAEAQARAKSDDIDKLRTQLRLPGPEARQKRESAVSALLGMRSLKAHEVLQEVMYAQEDPDGVIAAILAQLLPRLQNELDAVLGDVSKEQVKATRGSYLRPLILLAGARFPRPQPVIDRAFEALADGYESWDRVPAFRAELAASDRLDRLAAVRAAAGCRDLGLARELAVHLEDSDAEIRDAVSASLRGLTFRRAGFANKAEFDAWFEEVGSKSFEDLVVEAARSGERELAELQQRNRDHLAAIVLELIEAYVHHPEIRWREIQSHVLRTEPEDLTTVCLQRLRTVLARVESLTGSAQDRLAFFEQLEQRLAAAEAAEDVESQALLLEVCAYLTVPGETQSAGIEKRLAAALASANKGVRLAALSGLRRHPSDDNRREVVTAARVAMGNGTDVDVLRAALQTLHATRDWHAPSPDQEGSSSRADWVALLNDMIRQPQLPLDVRMEALQVLDLRDTEQNRVGEGFTVLVSVVEEQTQDASFRERALIQLEAYVVDPLLGQRYVQLLESCLADAAKEIRQSAAGRIHQLPQAGSVEDLAAWTQRLLVLGGGRLLEETDADVHRTLAESMRRAAEQRVEAKAVIEQFCLAAVELSKPTANNGKFRRKNLSDALSIVASQPGVALEDWVRAGEVLLDLGERDAVRAVLEGQQPNQALDKPDADPALVQRARLLTVNTALQRPGEKSWGDPAHEPEARAVLAAVGALADALPTGHDVTLLRMDIHGDLGQDSEVIDLAASLSSDGQNTLDAASRQRVARSYLALDKPDLACEQLLALPRDGTVSGVLLGLLGDACKAAIAKKEFVVAVQAGDVLLEHTPEDAPQYLVRLLLHNEALLGVDAANHKAVRDNLESKRALFEADGVPADLRARFEGLLSSAGAAKAGQDAKAAKAAAAAAAKAAEVRAEEAAAEKKAEQPENEPEKKVEQKVEQKVEKKTEKKAEKQAGNSGKSGQ